MKSTRTKKAASGKRGYVMVTPETLRRLKAKAREQNVTLGEVVPLLLDVYEQMITRRGWKVKHYPARVEIEEG